MQHDFFTDKFYSGWDKMSSGIESNIIKNRQADFVLKLDEVPAGATITVNQKKHQFDFGCNCLWLGQKHEFDRPYEEGLAGLFNLITTTFCLNDIQPQPGKWRFEEGCEEIFRRPPPDRVVNFARKHGIKLKGQPLLAGSWYPQWAKDMNYSDDQIRKLYAEYFQIVAERYGNVYDIFDLVNEALCHRKFPLYTENLEYVEWAFKTAYPMFPRRIDLELNEAHPHIFHESAKSGKNEHYNLVRRLLDNGTQIDSLGFQFHLWNAMDEIRNAEGMYFFDQVLERMNEFSEFGLPMYISEITIPSVINGQSMEAVQAELADKFYRLFFSVERMRGIIYWNLCDGPAWMGEGDCRGGLLDEFMRKKPAYLSLENLLKREWLTAFAKPAENSELVEFRGFKGIYDVIVESKEGRRAHEVSLTEPGTYNL